MKKLTLLPTLGSIVFALILSFSGQAKAQIAGNDRDVAIQMLNQSKESIRKNYYDPTFHGVDIDFVFDQAKERIKAASSRDALMMTIASAVLAFDDSHTTFLPPARAADIEYGWQVEMVGDECFVTHVKPGSDAEAKGLKVGDKLLAIDGFRPTRKNMWQMYYRYWSIAPTSRVKMTVLNSAESSPRVIDVQTKISKTATVISLQALYDRGVVKKGWEDSGKRDEFVEFGKDLLIWKMHSFSDSEVNIDTAMSKARDHKTLILDLRDNGGGSVEILKRLTGYFFDHDIKIADQKTRKDVKPLIAKTRGGGVFKGDLIVLINHGSASASELFSRTIQMEKRGKIIGDKSAGAVMESEYHEMDSGFGSSLLFATTVTMADLIMPDGQSLEKVGVTPDETLLPNGKDLAGSKDPVLAYTAKLANVNISEEKAGTLFPYEWPK